ncbi:hypothetical protein ACJX0J_039480, partial [Zea mays]
PWIKLHNFYIWTPNDLAHNNVWTNIGSTVGFLASNISQDDLMICLNRLAKPIHLHEHYSVNEDVHMNEPENPEDRLPDMVQDFFTAEEGGAQNSMFAAIEGDDAQWHKLKRKELQQLWLGVSTFDALSRRDFDLHAVMQMMVNSLLGTFLALPGNMMEVPIFQMSNMVGCTPAIYLFSNMEWFGMCLTTVMYSHYSYFLLLMREYFLMLKNKTCFIFHFNPLLLEVFLIVYKFDMYKLEHFGMHKEKISRNNSCFPIPQMGLKEIEVQINEHESIICHGRDRSMGLKLPTNSYGNNDNFI